MSKHQELWRTMISKSFNPRGWFIDEEDPRESTDCQPKESMMWVFRKNEEGTFTVGYYTPDRTWCAEGDYKTREEAADRVHWLNGGQERNPAVQRAAQAGFGGT